MSAASSGAERGAVSLALGVCFFVLYADAGSAAAAVDGIVLAGRDIAADTGKDIPAFPIAHFFLLTVFCLIIFCRPAGIIH